jgi:hypothetical protein
MEEDIAETGRSLDEKEEESDDQEEEEWSSYPCLPPNKSNSLTNTFFDRFHDYQRRMSVILIIVIIPLILLKYPFLMKLILAIVVTLIL